MTPPVTPPTQVESKGFAAEPFDRESRGDCILLSSDGVSFKVFRIILSLASPVFHTMFDLPQGTTVRSGNREASDGTEDIPTIPVSEPSSTLTTLLLLLYPARVVTIDSHDLAVEVIKAYDKYDIDIQSLKPFLHDGLLSAEGLQSDPLGVYAIAWRLGMKEEALNASRYLHTTNLNDERVKRDLIARSGDLNALLSLWDLRVRREMALDGIVQAVQLHTFRCGSHRQRTGQYDSFGEDVGVDDGTQNRVLQLRTKAREALNTPHPECRDIRLFLKIQDILPSNCGSCVQLMTMVQSEAGAQRGMAVIAGFPQTVEWRGAT